MREKPALLTVLELEESFRGDCTLVLLLVQQGFSSPDAAL